MDKAGEVDGASVVACGEASEVLEAAEASLDLVAMLLDDRDRICEIAVKTRFLGAERIVAHRATVDRIIATIDDTLARRPVRFRRPRVRDDDARGGIDAGGDRSTWHVSDVETLFVQRKISGTALPGARLNARVDVTRLAAEAVAGGA